MESKRTFAGYFVPKLGDIIFISIFFGVLLLGPRTLNIDGDLGRHITIGNYILSDRSIPTTDIFSHTMAGEKLTPHEWLSQVSFSLSNQAMGLNGIVLLEATIIAVTFLVVFKDTLKLSGSHLIAAGLTFWAAAASSLHWIARPHIFTFFFLGIWTPLIRSASDKPRRAFLAAPLIMFMWANTHGAFIAGFVVWACFIFGWLYDYLFSKDKPLWSTFRNLAIIGALSFLASLINPAGLSLWSTSLGYIQNDYLIGHTQEYLTPDFHIPGFIPFLALIAFMVFILSSGRKTLPTPFGLLLAGWMAMALYSARNIPLFAIIASPILGYYLSHPNSPIPIIGKIDLSVRNVEKQLRGYFWPLASVVIVIFLYARGIDIDLQGQGNQFRDDVFPVTAANWLEENPQTGNMYNYFTWGGYLLYRFWPEQPVFIDGQTDFYGENFTRDYAMIISASPGWEWILQKYDVSWVIVPIDSGLAKTLSRNHTWILIYKDKTAAIFHK